MAQAATAWTVTEFTRAVKGLLEESFPYPVRVQGEVTDFRGPAVGGGHYYFTIKDKGATCPVVLFRPPRGTVPEGFANGMLVEVTGNVTVYEPRGIYQLKAVRIDEVGAGELFRRIEELKRRLQEEGLFDESRKVPLPSFPRRVAVVTSPSAQAFTDFLKVLSIRGADISVLLVPTPVQGPDAPAAIASAFRLLEAFVSGAPGKAVGCDCVILTRGGGSLEDLMAFNEEPVARAIDAFRTCTGVPVISAIGHEKDISVADLVADVRAATPTAAAELVTRDREELRRRIADLRGRLARGFTGRVLEPADQRLSYALDDLSGAARELLRNGANRIRELTARLEARSPSRELDERMLRRETLDRALFAAYREGMLRRGGGLATLAGRLHALSPLAVLTRGYSITRRVADGHVVTGIEQVAVGDALEVRLARGAVRCRTESLTEHPSP